jgi:hypothetical protein
MKKRHVPVKFCRTMPRKEIKVDPMKKYKRFDIAMVVLILGIILALGINECHSAPPKMLITDYDFTNQNWHDKQLLAFFDAFEYCKLSISQKYFIHDVCREQVLHPLVIITKMQMEMSIIDNRVSGRYVFRERWCMAYGMNITHIKNGKKYWYYGGYKRQIWYAAKRMVKIDWLFDHGDKVKLVCIKDYIEPDNGATYVLYRYTPYYGWIKYKGHRIKGNINFKHIYWKYRSIWDNVSANEIADSVLCAYKGGMPGD